MDGGVISLGTVSISLCHSKGGTLILASRRLFESGAYSSTGLNRSLNGTLLVADSGNPIPTFFKGFKGHFHSGDNSFVLRVSKDKTL